MIKVIFPDESVMFDLSREELLIMDRAYKGLKRYVTQLYKKRDIDNIVKMYCYIVKCSYKGDDFEEFQKGKNYCCLMCTIFEGAVRVPSRFMEGVLYHPQSDEDTQYLEMVIQSEEDETSEYSDSDVKKG